MVDVIHTTQFLSSDFRHINWLLFRFTVLFFIKIFFFRKIVLYYFVVNAQKIEDHIHDLESEQTNEGC